MTERTLVRYRPAATGWWVAAENGAVAVLAPAVSAGTATAVWRKVGGGGIGAVIEALTGAFGTSLSAIPPFALAVAEAGGVRVAVRGAVEVVVEGDGGAESVSGEGVATWTERFLPGATRITIVPEPAADAGGDAGVGGGADAADENVPLRSGVIRAVMIVADLPAVPAGAGATGAGASASSADGTSASAPRDAEVPADAAVAAEGETTTETLSQTQDAADTLLPMATQQPSDAADDERVLWSETVARPSAVLPAALPDDGGDHDDQVGLDDGDHDGETIAASGRPRGLPPAPVYAASAPAPAPVSAPAPPSAGIVLGDHDGETIAVADMRAMRAAEPDRYESTDSVPARHPARGRIRLSTGRVVELERPVIIGRRPKSTRTSGSDLPTLVAVDSPEQDISRSHVEIRAEGEHVLVTDLDTTNGTVLLRGGQEPVRLHPGEPTMVITGDVLDLGDGVTVAFEDLP